MHLMKSIKMGIHKLPIPIIQGGMGIGVSRAKLAGAVAKAGGMGVISTAQIGYDYPGFQKDPEAANQVALTEQIKQALMQADGHGLVAVNIMSVTQLYGDYVRTAAAAGVNAIISGAGLPTDLPKYVAGTNVLIAPIVSSEKSANVILRYWDRKYNRTADFLVIEGPLAGGHLGFSPEDLDSLGQMDYDAEIKKIIQVKKTYEEKYGHDIPVFVAGGIMNKEDTLRVMRLGADGIQAGTRFVATEECDASDAYKQAYINATEDDVMIIKSPVGMPGRAIRNPFIEKVLNDSLQIRHCFNCLKACNPATATYCITDALIQAVKGNLDEGLIFCGARVGEINKISTVQEVVDDLFI